MNRFDLAKMLANVWREAVRIAYPVLSKGMLAVMVIQTVDFVTPDQLDGTWKWLTMVVSFLIIGWMCVKAVMKWKVVAFAQIKDVPNVSIEIRVGNLFLERGQGVVAINTNLETILNSEGGPIEDRSIQGQYTRKYYENGRQFGEKLEPTRTRWRELGRLGTDESLGEVIVDHVQGDRAILVAVATLEDGRVSDASARRIEETTTGMWENIRGEIAMEADNPVICPIIGAKYVKAPGLTPERLLKHHIRSFATVTRSRIICEKVIFLIGRADLVHINTDSIREFLIHECRYETLATGSASRDPGSRATEGARVVL